MESALDPSLGATKILEVMTKPLSVTALSPLGSDLSIMLLTLKDDEDIHSIHTIHGPITRARA
jgi:hypothetical protein